MWKVDLHSHTIFSKDCLTRTEDAIARAREIGLDKLAITEHDNLAGALRAKELAPDLIIVGEEIMTTHGELIAYFVKEEVPRGLSPQETVRRLREQGAVVAIPHPLDSLRNSAMGMESVLEVIGLVDALEVRNARCVRPHDNVAALSLAQEHGLLVTAGSDAHIPFELGHCYMEMPAFEDEPESFVDALQRGKPMGEESPFWPHFFSTYAKWRKRIKPVPYGGVLHRYGKGKNSR